MSDFLKFVTDNANNQTVGQSFIKALGGRTNNLKLQAWFKSQGYDVSLQECQELINKKEHIIKIGDCVKGY